MHSNYFGLDKNEFIISVQIDGIDEKIYPTNVIITEEISDVYIGQVDFLIKDNNSLNIETLLEKQIHIKLGLKGRQRSFEGILIEVSEKDKSLKDDTLYSIYQVKFTHMLYKLKLTKNSRVFQNKTPKDIISEILDINKIKKKKLNLIGDANAKIEYYTQYEESDFNFVARLMEEFAIVYFFDHSDGNIIISNAANSYLGFPSNEDIPMDYSVNRKTPTFNTIKTFSKTIVSNKVSHVVNSYNYLKPDNNLLQQEKSFDSNPEYYEWENYATRGEGEKIVKLKNEVNNNSCTVYNAFSNELFLSVGYTFQLSGHNDHKLNNKYVITKISHSFKCNNWNGGIVSDYTNRFDCVEKTKIFIKSNKTPIPKIYGNLLGVVTGPLNKTIFKDALNRVKVLFLWDKNSKKDENSSCWLRSMEFFSGSGFGSVFTPRIGTEVVIGFLNGDPNSPYIIGTLYNEKNTPPFNEKQETVVGIRTKSFDKKKGFNELSFDDQNNKELIYIKAEKDYKEEINANKTTSIENGDFKTSIKEGGLEFILNKGSSKLELKNGDYNVIVSDNIVIKSKKITFEALDDIEMKAGGNLSFTSKKNMKFSSTGTIDIDSLKNTNIKSKASVDIDAMTNVKLSSKVSMSFKTSSYTLTASMNLSITSKMNISVKSNIALTLKASAINNVSGALVKLG